MRAYIQPRLEERKKITMQPKREFLVHSDEFLPIMSPQRVTDSIPTNFYWIHACAHTGELTWNPALFGYRMETMDDLTFDERDSAPFMPKCVVVDPGFEWSEARSQRRIPWDDTIIYEMHMRGFTKRFPKISENLRGTFAGLGEKEVVDYIRSLGVTSVELLPIHAFVVDSHLLEKGL
jgi:isoamylase